MPQKTRKKPQRNPQSGPIGAKPPAPPAAGLTQIDAATIARALLELQIDVPYYSVRLVGGRLEFALYGGRVVYWQPAEGKVNA